jgi:hypothetical protein
MSVARSEVERRIFMGRISRAHLCPTSHQNQARSYIAVLCGEVERCRRIRQRIHSRTSLYQERTDLPVVAKGGKM